MQEMIDVTIERSEEQVFLIFNFETAIKMCLTSDDQEEIKAFFQNLLVRVYDDFILLKKEYSFGFKDPDSKDLFHDVAEKYVSNINTEIQSIYAKFD